MCKFVTLLQTVQIQTVLHLIGENKQFQQLPIDVKYICLYQTESLVEPTSYEIQCQNNKYVVCFMYN